MQLPKEFKERMHSMLGEDWDAFEKAFCEGENHSAIRINTLKKDAHNAIAKAFELGENVPWCSDGYYVQKEKISGNHPYHMGGLFYFQEPSAMAPAAALPIDEGDMVLDLCGAPGGKSTHLAAKLGGSGMLVANEIVRKRAQILSQNIERMGIKNAIVTSESPQKLSERFPLFFDKIMVDAPCSGEGMFRKEPQAITEWSIEHTLSCAARQKNILDSAAEMLKGGGMLAYSTCTFAPCENEEICAYMVKHHGFEMVEITLPALTDGRNDWCESDTDVSASKRLFPHIQKGEGHFLALFRKPLTENEGHKTPKYTPPKDAIKLYRDFEKENLNITLDGYFAAFGEKLYLLPENIDIDKLSVLRAGLELGECKKMRFEPSHALALALAKEDFKNHIELDADSGDIQKYLSGNVIPTDKKGWCVVTVDGYGIGWAKASGGIAKNHLPKGLRINI